MCNKTCFYRLSRLMTLLVIAMLMFSQADAQTKWYQDTDSDGWGNPSVSQNSSSQPSGYVRNNFDCDDNTFNGVVHPYEGPQFISDAKAGHFDMAMADNGIIYVAYVDKGESSKVTVKKKSGNGWVLVGSAGFTPTAANQLSLAIDHNNIPYVAYNNASYQDVRVMKYNGSSWDSVGSMIALDGRSPDLAIDTGNVPYIVFGKLWDHPIVKKYNGSNWVTIGTLGAGEFWNISSIAIDNAGAVYVVFRQYDPDGLYVMKYTGSSWVTLGSSLQSPSSYGIVYADIVIDNNDVPYVIHAESGTDVSVVSKYDSSSWVNLGGSFGESYYGSLAIDKEGTLYVFYSRASYNGVGMVQKYSGGGWPAVGPGIISGDRFYAEYTRIVIDSLGILHLGYLDSYASDDSISVKTIAPAINNASTPTLSGNTNIYCGSNTTLSITGGNLNDAAKWRWYTGSCGGTLIDSGTSVTVAPAVTTTYYVRGEDGCATAPGACASITVTANKRRWYADADNDGWGDASKDSSFCIAGPLPGYVPNNFDCKDNQVHATAWVNDGVAGFSAGVARYTDIATSVKGTTFVAYQDAANSNKATVMKKSGNSWVVVGSAGFTPAAAEDIRLAVDKNDMVYLAYREAGSYNIFVMKYNGSTWVTLGASLGSSFYPIMLAIDPGNIPYVVSIQSNKPVLHKYNGSNWAPVGNFTNGGYRPSVAFDAYGTPYILYDNYSELRVYQYKANAWVAVGSGIGSLGNNPTRYSSIAIDGNGTPYVFWSLDPLANVYYPGNVLKYNGSNWVTMGSIPESATNSGKIIIDPSGTPYVTFLSYNNNPGVVTRKYNGSGWVAIGSSPVVGNGEYPSFAIDSIGLPHIVFADGNNASKATVKTIKPITTDPAKPVLATSNAILCGGASATLTIQSGSLNDASQWHWYSSSCGGTLVGTGTTIQVTPATTTTYYARGEASCLPSPGICDSIVIISTTEPAVITVDPRDSIVCNNNNASFSVTATGAGLTYLWQVSNNGGISYNNVSNTGMHSGATTATLTLTGATTSYNGSLYRVIVSNACSPADTSDTASLTVNSAPNIISFPTGQSTCEGGSVLFSTFAVGNDISYQWQVSMNGGITWGNVTDGGVYSGATNTVLYVTGVTAAMNNYKYRVIASGTCTPDATSTEVTLTVNPIPTVNTVSNQSLCNGVTTTATTFSGTVSGTSYSWTNNTTSIGLAASGSGNIAAFTAANTGIIPVTATITVTPSANSCTGASKTFDITVNPTPTVNAVSSQVVCNDVNTSVVNFTGSVNNTTYSWSNNTSIGLAVSGSGSIPTFTGVNNGTSPLTSTFTVTPTANNCAGSNITFDITVNPTPAVNNIASQVVCNGATTAAVNYAGVVTGTMYGWMSSNASIGLSTSGSGDIAAFTATNAGVSPVTSVITVVPVANNCTGTAKAFEITVNPTPSVNIVSDQAVCNTANTSVVNFIGSVLGTTYSWTNNTPSIGMAASGYGDIPAFTAINSGTVPVFATFAVAPTANNCTGQAKTFNIRVNPTPTVNAISSQSICNGDVAAAVNFSGAVSGTTFGWNNATNSIGLTTIGTGNIGAFTATNNTAAPVPSLVTVTPMANGCTGTAGTFTYTVKPSPVVSALSNQVICNGAANASVTPTSTTSGTSFMWTNNKTSIGLAASGGAVIPSFTSVNTGTVPVTATIVVSPTAAGCTGPASSYTIVVNPTPGINPVSGQAVCDGAMTNTINFGGTVAGTSYSWTNNTPSIGLAANGTGNIPPFTALNTTTVPVTATIIATAHANGCTGTSTNFDVLVYPTPGVNTVASQAVCDGALTSIVAFSSPVSNATYWWTNNNTSIGLGTNGPGNISVFAGINPGTAPEVANITVAATANGCTGPSSNFTITVNPIPALTSTLAPPDVCNNIPFSYTPASATAGTSFAWSRAVVAGISNAAASGANNVMESLNNTITSPVNVIYAYTLAANGCMNTQQVKLQVNPTPRLSSPMADVICSGDEFLYAPASATKGTTYTWSRPTTAGVYPATASGSGNISENPVNITKASLNVVYNYVLTANGCNNNEQVTLTLHPRPKPPFISVKPPADLCSNTDYQNFGTIDPTPAGSVLTWTATNASIWRQGDDHKNAIISFPNPGKAVITLTTTYISTGCDTSTDYEVTVGNGVSPQPEVIYHNGQFICLLNNADSYKWGYDDNSSLDSTLIVNQTGQNFYMTNPDFVNKHYWVMVNVNGCMQKAYFNKPAGVTEPIVTNGQLKLYPNPASEVVNIELESISYGDIEFVVADMTGRQLYQVKAVNNTAKVDVSNYAQGIYSISCMKDGVRIVTSKFIKQ